MPQNSGLRYDDTQRQKFLSHKYCRKLSSTYPAYPNKKVAQLQNQHLQLQASSLGVMRKIGLNEGGITRSAQHCTDEM